MTAMGVPIIRICAQNYRRVGMTGDRTRDVVTSAKNSIS